MRTTLALSLLLGLSATASAQETLLDSLLHPLSVLVGQWEGEATAMTRSGPLTMHQTEDVRVELGGHLITVEGTGREVGTDGSPGEIVFNAFGLFSIDATTETVWLDAFTMEGRHTRVAPTLTADGFEWSIEPENGPVIHYVMRIDEAGRWHEVGRMTMDGGETWRPFFEMTLSRVEAADRADD